MIFKNAKYSSFTAKREEGGPVYRLHFEADLTAAIAREMEWDIFDQHGDIRHGFKAPTMMGLLVIKDWNLIPDAPILADKGLREMKGQEVRDFKVAMIKDSAGRRRPVLRFILTTTGPISSIDRYWKQIANADASLEIGVTEKQTSFDHQDPDPEEQYDDDAQQDLIDTGRAKASPAER